MEKILITGAMLRDAVLSASNNITNNRLSVDALNVFPVPDGDTGTNMALTMQAAAKEMEKLGDSEHISRVADICASALLRGARGNSGVILSLIFRGIAEGFRGCAEASGTTISSALQLGAENAYKAVMEPTEGTILTVIRVAAERAAARALSGATALSVFEEACRSAEQVLEKTPEMLVELRRAKVVDAGGQGLVHILNGMLSVFKNSKIISISENGESSETAPFYETALPSGAGDIKYSYCTEFIINKNEKSFLDALLLRSHLESIGDCVVVVPDKDIIKVHVHSNEPGDIITKALEYGELVNVKIDNMRQQHKNASWGIGDKITDENENLLSGEYEKSFGFISVCAGEGLASLFRELGADETVSGGQTMNPSTNDLLSAIKKINAEHIFILPNNKNVIMSAEQTIPLTKRKISIIPTIDIPQGIAAMLSFDESASARENELEMSAAAKKAACVQITYAARDSYVNGKPVKQGDILGLENGKISVTDTDPHNAAFRCVRRLANKNTSVITCFYGNGISESEAEKLAQRIMAKMGGNTEISVVYGGQPVYYYIISIE